MIKVMNVKRYAINYKYMVAQYIEGNWWFYGAWNNQNDAVDIALKLDNESDSCRHWVFALEDCDCDWRD